MTPGASRSEAMAGIACELRDGCTLVTIERPEVLNVLDRRLVGELTSALERVGTAADSRVLVLTGAGDAAFCAGADLRELVSLPDLDLHQFLVETRKLFRTLAELPLPTIAAVNGHAHGAGAELACICDLRVGSENATFRFPGLAYGMAVGTWHLPTVVGLPKARELLLTTETIDAREAHRIGLLNRLHAPAELLERSLALARRIGSHPPEVAKEIKSLLNRTVGAPLQQRFFRELYSNQEHKADLRAREYFLAALSAIDD